MGGLALAHITRRYLKDEFLIVTSEIQEKLLTCFSGARMPYWFREKESFGDADFLVNSSNITFNIIDKVNELFSPQEIIKNGDVITFDYKELQVDLILTPEENWQIAYQYFSYNDIGNLIGRYAHRFGLKYGFDGLRFVYRGDGKIIGEISVSKNITDILEFLGLDSERYAQGFNSLLEIFDFISSGKYFDPYMYDMNTLNRINRERNEKRKTYQEFLKYVEPLKETVEPYVYNKNKDVYIGLIDRYFPGFMKQYLDLYEKEQRRLSIQKIFNGHLVMQIWPTLQGKELGNTITKFKDTFETQLAYEEFILNNDINTIYDEFAKINSLHRTLNYSEIVREN